MDQLMSFVGRGGSNTIENASPDDDYENRNESSLSTGGHQFVGTASGDATLDRDQVNDMIAASEARTDTKFARIEGKLDLILERFEAGAAKSSMQIQAIADQEAAEREHVRSELTEIRGDYKATRNTVIATGISVVILVVAVLTLYVTALSTGAVLGNGHGASAPAAVPAQSNRVEVQTAPSVATPTQNRP